MSNTGKTKGEKHSYESNLQTVLTFSTVEDFWGLMHSIPAPSHLETSSNLHLFREGIKPMWEDSANAEGGKWVLELRGVRESIDQIWLTIALDLIAGTLDRDDCVTGIVLSRRKTSNKIAVWTKDKSDHNANMHIGTRVKDVLNLQPGSKAGLEYCHHTDSIKSGTSYTVQARVTIPIG
jgi:translation initiation factor 4E